MQSRRLGFLIYRLNNLAGRFLNQNVTEDEKELSCTNARIIRFVGGSGERSVYQKDVEKEFGITRSTASRVLMLMEQKGLVERHGVKHDARLKKLVLTEKSERLREIMAQRGRRLDELLLKGFSEEETRQLYDYINRITENINEELL